MCIKNYLQALLIGLTAFSKIDCAVGQIIFESPNPLTQEKFKTVDSAILAGEFGEIHSLLIVQNGKLIFENYYNGWKADSLHQLQSATKSIVATLLGCAIKQGMIPSATAPISNYYHSNLFKDALKKKIRIDDLLTQRHGLKWKEAPWDAPDNTWRKVLATEGDWYQMILETPMDTLPGTRFNYSNAAPVLTTGIIQKAAKMNIDSFAKRYLFDPLGIEQFHFWAGNGGPQNNGMALLFLRSRDMAKIGQLYLQNGQWDNQEIMPAQFVKDATSAKVKHVEPNGVYSGYDYGYFWWSNPVWRKAVFTKPINAFLARGAGGQNIIVYPEKNLVVVTTAWNMQAPNKPQEIFDKYILGLMNE